MGFDEHIIHFSIKKNKNNEWMNEWIKMFDC